MIETVCALVIGFGILILISVSLENLWSNTPFKVIGQEEHDSHTVLELRKWGQTFTVYRTETSSFWKSNKTGKPLVLATDSINEGHERYKLFSNAEKETIHD